MLFKLEDMMATGEVTQQAKNWLASTFYSRVAGCEGMTGKSKPGIAFFSAVMIAQYD